MDIILSTDYKNADQYLIDNYNLFKRANVNLLEISQFFSQGRYAILNAMENDDSHDYDPIILLGFADEIIEQIFARYGMIHQQASMQEITLDRDRIAAKLEMNEQYLNDILYSSDSAIMMIDNEEKFIAWNKGAESIFGYTEEEVIGKPSSLLLPDDEKYSEELNIIKKEVNNKGYISIFDTERKTKEGNIVSVKLSVSKLPNTNGEYSGRSVIIKDYTEVKKLQQQIDQSEKLAVLGQLAAGVAHEIGNPLASISSLVQILQRRNKDSFTNEQLANIKENIDRISRIVRELIDFSRPPSREQESTEITDVIKTAIGIVKYDKRVKKVDFNTDLQPSLPNVNIIPDQLLQVFVNILINALDAIQGTGTIEVTSGEENDNVIVEISDNGCGMNQKTAEQIFDPFFTTKEVGGLGLTVSYGIIKRFGGEIKVNSKLNEGSKFSVILPVEK
jgi:PAS domain S-box-containing protein